MDFHQLRVFIEVAKQKNFSRAAENVFLSQPTISAHIKALEDEIGLPLLDRSLREIKLTVAGKTLLRYAHELLEIKEEALASIQKKYAIIEGHLKIAASSVPSAYLLPQLLLSFHQKYPTVSFSVLLRDSKQVLENIRDYSFDLGFSGTPPRKRIGLGYVKLIEDELIIAASPKFKFSGTKTEEKKTKLIPLKLDACLGSPFLLRESGSATRKVFEDALKKYCRGNNKITLNVIAYLESQEAIKEAVKKGLGITVISQKAVEEELEAGTIRGYTLPELKLKRNFYLVFRKKRILPPLSQAFLDYTVNFFQPAQTINS
jgi:DNA-binding transcriptional LysR family regulator